jgi:serine/threonine protein kinase
LAITGIQLKLGLFTRRVMDPVTREYFLSETFCGSLQYAAPEVIHADPYDPKYADMWSLGVILFAVLNKAMPFDESHPKELYRKQMARTWHFRAKVAEHVSTDCVMLVKCLLDPEPAKRPNIDQMVYSDWIVKDPKLRVMTHQEFSALAAARLLNQQAKMPSVIEFKVAAPKVVTQPEQILPMRCSDSIHELSAFKPVTARQSSALRQAKSRINIHEETETQQT